jgi:hypothetical protein
MDCPELSEHDVVRVVRLRTSGRNLSGSEGIRRAPRVGDEGTIVNVPAPGAFVVECVAPDGDTVWLADFRRDELERVESDRS